MIPSQGGLLTYGETTPADIQWQMGLTSLWGSDVGGGAGGSGGIYHTEAEYVYAV